MAAIDVEKFLETVSEDSPAGEDLEYDASFGALERAAQGRPEQRMGDKVLAAEEPQWRDVYDMAGELFGRTRDIRIAIHLMHAGLHRFGIAALADGLRLLHGLLEDYWDTVYPRLEEEDNNDPTIRMNSLAALNDRAGFIHSLQRIPLVESKQLGKFGLRQIHLAAGDLSPGEDEDVPSDSVIAAACMDCELDALAASAEAANTAADELEAIGALLREKVGHEHAPDFDVLASEIETIRSTLNSSLAERGVEIEGDAGEAGAAAKNDTGLGQIQSREDAIRILDRLTEYFRRTEPSSPVPLLLQRAKRLISKDFMEILKDLAPSGVEQARVVSGSDDE